jgi:hypothetical protein
LLYFSDPICFLIPLPASIISKKPAKIYKKPLLIARRTKLVHRITR